MAKKIFVYCTLTNNHEYGPWLKGGADLPSRPKVVSINGGANRADRDNRMFTPQGELTVITEEQLAICEADPLFIRHRENGYIVVSAHEDNPDIVAADMTARSGDAPLTPEIIKAENDKKPDDKKQEVTANVGAAPARTRSRGRRKK